MMTQDDLLGNSCNPPTIIGDIPSHPRKGKEESHNTFPAGIRMEYFQNTIQTRYSFVNYSVTRWKDGIKLVSLILKIHVFTLV
jgi:hypothetical protein